MSLLLGKLAALLVLPLSSSLLLLAVGVACIALRWRRAALGFGLAGFTLLWMASTRVVGEGLIGSLESEHPVTSIASLEPADAILVLGGGMRPVVPPREFPEVSEGGDRVLHAARLFRSGKGAFVIASGGRMPWLTRTPAEANAMTTLLVELGVPPDAIVPEFSSTNTWENCVHSKELLDARAARSVLLVTSALHMRRALATCRTTGLDARPAPTDYWVADEVVRTWLDYAPDAQALVYTQLALRERLGFWVYQYRGWIRP